MDATDKLSVFLDNSPKDNTHSVCHGFECHFSSVGSVRIDYLFATHAGGLTFKRAVVNEMPQEARRIVQLAEVCESVAELFEAESVLVLESLLNHQADLVVVRAALRLHPVTGRY